MKILLTESDALISNGDLELDVFESLGEYVEYKNISRADLLKEAEDAEIILCNKVLIDREIFDIAKKLKSMGANRIFMFSTFGLFVEGHEKFDEFYANGYFDKVFTTNLIYQTPELLEREWYCSVNMSKYIALLVDTINCDNSISKLLDPVDRIKKVVEKYNNK